MFIQSASSSIVGRLVQGNRSRVDKKDVMARLSLWETKSGFIGYLLAELMLCGIRGKSVL
ncbi:hypothetical protein [Methylococcus capsulatus]|jgi:hypothetical protein|uniref:hypothetical protein n=1 Tax=Methylococcus capsulatus TaxID=414 RepID=UPI0012B63936|nr:hypothetical protein [Methylococcus capsulatus]